MPVSERLDYRCPGCGQVSQMIFGPTQAICTNDKDCAVISWNPSQPVQDWKVVEIDLPWEQP